MTVVMVLNSSLMEFLCKLPACVLLTWFVFSQVRITGTFPVSTTISEGIPQCSVSARISYFWAIRIRHYFFFLQNPDPSYSLECYVKKFIIRSIPYAYFLLLVTSRFICINEKFLAVMWCQKKRSNCWETCRIRIRIRIVKKKKKKNPSNPEHPSAVSIGIFSVDS